MAGVYCRAPDQGEPDDEAFLLQLQEALHLQALIPGSVQARLVGTLGNLIEGVASLTVVEGLQLDNF